MHIFEISKSGSGDKNHNLRIFHPIIFILKQYSNTGKDIICKTYFRIRLLHTPLECPLASAPWRARQPILRGKLH